MEQWSKELGETHTRTNESKFRCRSISTPEFVENGIGQMKVVLYRQTGVCLVLKGCFRLEKIAKKDWAINGSLSLFVTGAATKCQQQEQHVVLDV